MKSRSVEGVIHAGGWLFLKKEDQPWRIYLDLSPEPQALHFHSLQVFEPAFIQLLLHGNSAIDRALWAKLGSTIWIVLASIAFAAN
jgi:hypothetical protein